MRSCTHLLLCANFSLYTAHDLEPSSKAACPQQHLHSKPLVAARPLSLLMTWSWFFFSPPRAVCLTLQRADVRSHACSPSLALMKHHLRAVQRPLTSKGGLLRSPNSISITPSTVPPHMPSGGTLPRKLV